MLQVRQVQCLADHVGSALWENDMAAIIALVDCVEDVLGVIGFHVVVTLDVAVLFPEGRLRPLPKRLLRFEASIRSLAMVL